MMINWPHAHLILNHFPVLGGIFAFLILGYGMVLKSRDIQKLGFLFCVLIALISIPAYLTGDQSTRVVRYLPDVQRSLIRHHSFVAFWSLMLMEFLGVVALAGLWVSRKSNRIPDSFLRGALLLTIVISGLMAWTADLGGEIRHTEIRPGFKQIIPPGTRP